MRCGEAGFDPHRLDVWWLCPGQPRCLKSRCDPVGDRWLRLEPEAIRSLPLNADNPHRSAVELGIDVLGGHLRECFHSESDQPVACLGASHQQGCDLGRGVGEFESLTDVVAVEVVSESGASARGRQDGQSVSRSQNRGQGEHPAPGVGKKCLGTLPGLEWRQRGGGKIVDEPHRIASCGQNHGGVERSPGGRSAEGIGGIVGA